MRALVLHPWLHARRQSPDEPGERAARKPAPSARDPQPRLAEAAGLARAISLDIVAAIAIRVRSVRPSAYFGRGKVEEVKELVEAEDVALVVVDAALTPVQQRNLEKAWGAKVIDRTGLILEIFGERARSHEGRLQVELAHLTYQKSRLVRSWTHLERQRGGLGFVGGPGETQIEADRRMIDERIARIREALGEVTRTRALHRRSRRQALYPVVALVGYTNAGKSTLFNQLTEARVLAKDILFATLDPTMRGVSLPSGRRAILSDTVGFISALPTHLVAAFRATLEEVREADLILHVRDLSAAEAEAEAQKAEVETVLETLGIDVASSSSILELWNKMDLLSPAGRAAITAQAQRKGAIVLSALVGEGIDGLLREIDRRLGQGRAAIDFDLAASDGAAIAWLYAHGEVLARHDEGERTHLRVRLDKADRARFEKRLVSA